MSKEWTPPTARGILPEPEVKAKVRVRNKRKESNEEIMLRALDKFGCLTMRVMPMVKDTNYRWKALRGRSIMIRKIPNQGTLFEVLRKITATILDLKGKGKGKG